MDQTTPSFPPLQAFGLDASKIEMDRTETVYQGYAKVEKLHLRHPKFDGGQSPTIGRELFVSGDAVMVIPFDVHSQTVLLIEQFRVAPLHRGDHPWIFEGIAGRIEPGEAPEDVARRESAEEAGLTLSNLEEMGGFFLSPGIVAEHMSFFCAEADLSEAGGIFGLDEEAEDIRSVVVSLDDALAAVDDGRIVNAPTGLALLWLHRHRERLTAYWTG